MVFSRSARMRVQLIPLRLSRVLRKTLSSSTWAFSGLRITASKSACCLPAAAIWERSPATSLRTSATCALSALASVIKAASEATSRVPTATEATSMARSRRKGWLARLMGIFISIGSIIFGDGPQIPQQSRVILPLQITRSDQAEFQLGVAGEQLPGGHNQVLGSFHPAQPTNEQ